MGDVPAIRSERLELVSLGPDVLEALVEGRHDTAESLAAMTIPRDWPGEHDRRFIAGRARQMREDPGPGSGSSAR